MSVDYEDDFLDAKQKYEYNKMLEKADNIVLATAAGTGLTGVVPIPFADAPMMIGEQVAMMIAINAVFGFEVKKDVLKSLVISVIGTGGATIVGKTIAANLLKLIPGAGSVAGAAVSGGTSAVVTLAMGKAYIALCKAVKVGRLELDDIGKKRGKEILKENFRSNLKKNSESGGDS